MFPMPKDGGAVAVKSSVPIIIDAQISLQSAIDDFSNELFTLSQDAPSARKYEFNRAKAVLAVVGQGESAPNFPARKKALTDHEYQRSTRLSIYSRAPWTKLSSKSSCLPTIHSRSCCRLSQLWAKGYGRAIREWLDGFDRATEALH
jgi:hypothetical protein